MKKIAVTYHMQRFVPAENGLVCETAEDCVDLPVADRLWEALQNSDGGALSRDMLARTIAYIANMQGYIFSEIASIEECREVVGLYVT